ncbi:DUF2500 family protein [Kitasatospora sp. NPDC057904]|uniref:DUF2500 family protein n=1 Tax=unclassified Kitasatospora TaxID=2633591 RepID=UPI0036DACD56
MPVLVFMLLVGCVILLMLVAGVSTSGSVSRATVRAFRGEVIRRRSDRHTLTTGMRTDYWLDVRTDEGEEISVAVSGRIYGRFKAGDRIVKRAGERWPTT